MWAGYFLYDFMLARCFLTILLWWLDVSFMTSLCWLDVSLCLHYVGWMCPYVFIMLAGCVPNDFIMLAKCFVVSIMLAGCFLTSSLCWLDVSLRLHCVGWMFPYVFIMLANCFNDFIMLAGCVLNDFIMLAGCSSNDLIVLTGCLLTTLCWLDV